MKLLVALALLCAAAAVHAQQLYKWVDESGKVHYTDRPPPDSAKTGQKLDVRNAPSPSPSGNAATPAAAKSAADLDMEFRKRQLKKSEDEQKQKKDAEANSEKQKNCIEAKNRMTQLERGGRVAKYGPNGETQYLTDDEIVRETVSQRKVVDSWCK